MEDILKENKDEEKKIELENGDTRTPAAKEDKTIETMGNSEDIENLLMENNGSSESPVNEESIVEKEEIVENGLEPESTQGEGIVEEGNDTTVQAPEETFNEPKFTQSQVNEMMGRARREGRESERKTWFDRYGVNDEKELDDLFGKGQIYADLNSDYETGQNDLREARSENALLKVGILQERWDDAKAILGSKGLEVSEENLRQMLSTHPEWVPQQQPQTQTGVGGGTQEGVKIPLNENDLEGIAMGKNGTLEQPKPQPITLTKLGADPSPKKEQTDREIAEGLFGVGKFNN